jgi:hypothetical protein
VINNNGQEPTTTIITEIKKNLAAGWNCKKNQKQKRKDMHAPYMQC